MRRRTLASLALCAVALGTTLLLCEATVRVLDGQPITALRLPPPPPPVLAPPQRLDPTIGGGPLPSEIDPEWLESTPAEPLRRTDDPEIRRLQEAAVGSDVRPFELFRVWNRYLVERTACNPGSLFQKLPQPLLVFDPSPRHVLRASASAKTAVPRARRLAAPAPPHSAQNARRAMWPLSAVTEWYPGSPAVRRKALRLTTTVGE